MTKDNSNLFDTIEDAIEDVKQGKMIVIVDDEDRENEGDLMIAAEMCTPEAVNFMAKIRTRVGLFDVNGAADGSVGFANDGAGKPGAVRDPLHGVDRREKGYHYRYLSG